MRTKQIVPILALTLFAMLVLGQTNSYVTNAPPVPGAPGVKAEATNLVLAAIPLLVPIIVAGFRVGLKFIPSWSYPIVASLLGVGLNALSGLVGWGSTSAINGAILGLAGTGMREMLTQVQQKVIPEK